MSKETREYRRFAITAARDLFYPESVISALRKATTEAEIARIMGEARRNAR
jgi:hypothetical protein